MDETGIVCEVKEDFIKLLMKGSESCEGCTACSVDGGPQKRVLTINENVDCELGDEVTVSIHPASPYISIFTLFVLPLILILVFYSLANRYLPISLVHRDVITVLAAIGGLVASFPAIKMVDKFINKHESNLIQVKKVDKRHKR